MITASESVLYVALIDTSVTLPFHILSDGNGNITDYVTTDGTNVAHYEYGPFGGITASSGSKKDYFTHRFSTKLYDEDAGLIHYELRDYSGALGRWLSRDPIGEDGGIALYAFVLNGPLNHADYLGLDGTITIITDKTTCDDWFIWWLTPRTGVTVRDVASMEDVISSMEVLVDEWNEKLDRINLSGHGLGGGVGAQSSRGNINFATLTEDQKRRLKRLLTDDAQLYLYVCDAATGSKAMERIQGVADDLKVCVHGKDGGCDSGPDGGFFKRWAEAGISKVIGFFMKADLGGWKKVEPTETSCPGKEEKLCGGAEAPPKKLRK